MAFRILGLHHKSKTSQMPEGADNCSSDEHVINMAGNSNDFASMDPRERLTSGLEQQSNEFQPSTSSRTVPVYQPPILSPGSDARNSTVARRGINRGHRRSPLNSVLWISVELFLTVGQIIAAVVVFSLSKNEKPGAPLRTWIWGYASGCCGILPLLYWRFKHRNRGSEQDSPQLRIDSLEGNGNTLPLSSRVGEGEVSPATSTTARGTQVTGPSNRRLKAFVEYFKMALDCFFAVWFVVGNVWIFGGHSSSAEAPNLYRLCIVFLTFSCIGYAMPFILCTAICCCLPCLTSVLGFREDLSNSRGATQESINALPTYKFKEKKNKSSRDKESKVEGGTVASGTEKERTLSGEDAVCCVCLSKYANNDELRELPCSHLFHKHCVDKWLKISGTCPLCKAETGKKKIVNTITEATANLRNES